MSNEIGREGLALPDGWYEHVTREWRVFHSIAEAIVAGAGDADPKSVAGLTTFEARNTHMGLAIDSAVFVNPSDAIFRGHQFASVDCRADPTDRARMIASINYGDTPINILRHPDGWAAVVRFEKWTESDADTAPNPHGANPA